ncbi:MAG: hypothetical protein OEU90_10830, partial [Gammaproteobacteria bacterium]|nr:hypothetical protein [Gammaproteobacteria bacterium]
VAFYNGDAFNNSPAGQLLAGATGSGINLDATQVVAVAAFLRVINALENIRASDELLDRAFPVFRIDRARQTSLIKRAGFEIEDSVEVLAGAGLHAAAVALLRKAHALANESLKYSGDRRRQLVDDARAQLTNAQIRMVEL